MRSDLQASKEDVEYTRTSNANRQKAMRLNSQPCLRHDIESRTKCLTTLRQQPQLSVSDIPNSVTYIKKAVGGTENHQTQPHLEHNKNDFQKVDATKFSTLSKLKNEIKLKDKKPEMQKPQKQQQQHDADVEAKPIIENGVSQPHNQQHLTVNQAEMKQQLSPHYSKLLNVVNHRIKRQTPAVNSNDNNNNDNQQQYTTFFINNYSFKQPEQQQKQPTVVQYQLQQKPQQYQLQNYQPNQSQNKKTYNNIELIASGKSFLTIPQSSTVLTDRQQQPQQQQQQTMIISISQPKAEPLPLSSLTASQTLPIPLFSTTFPSSPLAATATGFKPLLPQEIVMDLNEGPATPPPLLVCKTCCVPHELPCSQCCDGNPLLNAKTLKTLGG